jgi:hypothetical protein
MKKFLNLICFAILLVALNVDAQSCSNREPVAHFTMSYGIDNTLAGDLAIVTENSLRIGVGAIAHVNNTVKELNGVEFREFAWGVYGQIAYQFPDVVIGANLGNIFNNPNEIGGVQLRNTNEFLYGGFVGYRLSKRTTINLGYNNLSNINFGLGIGI